MQIETLVKHVIGTSAHLDQHIHSKHRFRHLGDFIGTSANTNQHSIHTRDSKHTARHLGDFVATPAKFNMQ